MACTVPKLSDSTLNQIDWYLRLLMPPNNLDLFHGYHSSTFLNHGLFDFLPGYPSCLVCLWSSEKVMLSFCLCVSLSLSVSLSLCLSLSLCIPRFGVAFVNQQGRPTKYFLHNDLIGLCRVWNSSPVWSDRTRRSLFLLHFVLIKKFHLEIRVNYLS